MRSMDKHREENIKWLSEMIARGLAEKEKDGVNKSSIALRAGVSPSRLGRVARGEQGLPKPEFLRKIAPFIGVPFADLMIAAGYLSPKEQELDAVKELLQALEITERWPYLSAEQRRKAAYLEEALGAEIPAEITDESLEAVIEGMKAQMEGAKVLLRMREPDHS